MLQTTPIPRKIVEVEIYGLSFGNILYHWSIIRESRTME
jgi:hypothetical protein